MSTYLLDFSPAAWAAYRDLRSGPLGSRLRDVLSRLALAPEAVRAEPGARRCYVVEETLRQAPEVWGLPVTAPDGGAWLVIWRELAPVVEIGYIGPAPVPSAGPSGGGSAGPGRRPVPGVPAVRVPPAFPPGVPAPAASA